MKRLFWLLPFFLVISLIATVIYIDSNSVVTIPDRRDGYIDWPQSDPHVLTIGNPDAKVTIIEYGEFKCPECVKLHQGVGREIRSKYVDTGLVKIVYRPYPLYADDGVKALIASYCVAEQGRFAQYHDLIMDQMWLKHYADGDYKEALEIVLTPEVMNGIYKQANIDPVSLSECAESKKYFQTYMDDVFKSSPDSVLGTPTFIIAGQKVVGVQSFVVYEALIDYALNTAR